MQMMRKYIFLTRYQLVCCQSYTWSLPDFRSRDKDGDHTIRSAIAENPMLQANFMTLRFIEPKLLPIEVSHCGNRNFRPFSAPLTLTFIRWPSYTNLTRTPWRYTACVKMNFLNQGFRKLSGDRHTLHIYRETEERWVRFNVPCSAPNT